MFTLLPALTDSAGVAAEKQRLAFLLNRDGLATTLALAARNRQIYRRAVLNPDHFGSKAPYRRRFIESYVTLKQFLAARA